MAAQRNALKAGIFMIISLVLLIAIIVAIHGVQNFTQPMKRHSVRFGLADNISGLRVGDEVRIGGMKAGLVEKIELGEPLPNSKEPTVLVQFTLPRRIELRDGAHVVMESTLTGNANLNIDSLGSGAELANGQMLAGAPSPLNALFAQAGSFGQIISDVRTQTIPRVNNTLDSFKKTGDNATDLITTAKGKVDPAVERYNAFAEAGRKALVALEGWFGPTTGDFKQTVANLRTATDKLPAAIEKIDDILQRSRGTVTTINESLADVRQAVANTRDVTASARSVLTSNRSKLDGMIGALKNTSDNLNAASTEIRHSPWRLLYQPKAGEVANLNLYDSVRQFAAGANDLNDAASALRDALNDPNVDKAQLQKLIEQLDASFASFGQIEQQMWKRVRE